MLVTFSTVGYGGMYLASSFFIKIKVGLIYRHLSGHLAISAIHDCPNRHGTHSITFTGNL